MQRVRWIRFPSSLLVQARSPDGEQKVLARLGRDGWFRVFLGRGRRVELPDGTKWRIGSGGMGGELVPVVTCPTGRLAVGSSVGQRSYGINGKDYAYNFYPTSRKRYDQSPWMLTEHGAKLATFQADSVYAERPVPLATILICFTLIKYGVPGEGILVPNFSWQRSS